MAQAKIGIIGGSGLYHMQGMSEVEEVQIDTPFGRPSDVITVGKIEGVDGTTSVFLFSSTCCI